MGGTSVNDTAKQMILDHETGDLGSRPKLSANSLRGFGREGKKTILVDQLLWARHWAKNFPYIALFYHHHFYLIWTLIYARLCVKCL